MPNQKNINGVKSISEKLSKAKSVYFTDYLGLNVSSVTKLRKNFYDEGIEYIVVKNTLLKIASVENKIDLEESIFSGSTAIAISYDEPVMPAKIIKGFLKEHDLPAVKGIYFEGSYVDPNEFEKIANLPSKNESLTKIAIVLKSPLQNFTNLLNSPLVNLVNILNGIKNSKSKEN